MTTMTTTNDYNLFRNGKIQQHLVGITCFFIKALCISGEINEICVLSADNKSIIKSEIGLVKNVLTSI